MQCLGMHNDVRERFRKLAHGTSELVGTPIAFALSVLAIIIWLVSGPVYHFSDTWQLIINTTTTIITFLMVFLIQNSQNRETRALHLKLDELIRAVHGARNELVDLEEMSDEELQALHDQFKGMHEKVTSKLNQRRSSHRR